MSLKYTSLNENCQIDIKQRTSLGSNVVFGKNCKKIDIGFGCFIGRDVYIDVEELSIGDYTTIHHGSILHGIKTSIGHNCWFGHYTIIDSLGGYTQIGNGVGVGAHSQLWSHMKFGDVLEGCRWNSTGTLILEDDVWLVGHSIVGPIHAKKKAMLMTGSVAVKNLEENQIYAGTPAQNVTDKLGLQFSDLSLKEKISKFEELKRDFERVTGYPSNNFVIVDSFSNQHNFKKLTQFNLRKRIYLPRYTEDEFRFMKFLLYDKAKFVPA